MLLECVSVVATIRHTKTGITKDVWARKAHNEANRNF